MKEADDLKHSYELHVVIYVQEGSGSDLHQAWASRAHPFVDACSQDVHQSTAWQRLRSN